MNNKKLEKFAHLLNNQELSVIFNNTTYKNEQLIQIVFNNIRKWNDNGHFFIECGYVLAVGENSFQFLLYILIASVLNLKIILITPKQIEYFYSNDINNEIEFILTFRHLSNCSKKLLYCTLNNDLERVISYYELNINLIGQSTIMFCTSGTTSQFKIAKYQEYILYQNAHLVGNYLGLSAKDRCLCVFNVGYMYGFSVTMSMLIKGGSVVLPTPTISSQVILEYLLHENITLLPIVGGMINSLFDVACGKFFPNLTIINASDKIYVNLVEKILKLAPIFWNNMGQTESGPRIFALPIYSENIHNLQQYSHNGVIALGYPVHKDIMIEIRDDNGQIVQDGKIGELFYKTKFGMIGYLNNIDSIANDWRSSGDLVYKNSNGMVYWVSRKSQSIKFNGIFVNLNLLQISFEEIEFINQAFFVVDDKYNKIYGFFNILNYENRCLSNNEIKIQINNYYIKQFPLYPRLSLIFFLSEFPKTESGKINIHSLLFQARELLNITQEM